MAFRWLADDGRLLVVFGSSLPHFLKKNVVRVGSAHTNDHTCARDATIMESSIHREHILIWLAHIYNM